MIDNLKRIREPLTWAVIVLVAANLVLGIVQLVQQVQQAVPLFEAFQSLGGSAMSISLVIAVVALVSTCFFIAPADALRLVHMFFPIGRENFRLYHDLTAVDLRQSGDG